MQAVMQHASQRNFFTFLTRPHFVPGDIIDRDFDEEYNRKPVTAEPLDWHLTRHWPVLAEATD
jgi:hypothetical protein